jgi:hypothetical protein
MSTIDIGALDIRALEALRDACNRRLLELRHTRGLTLPELLQLLDEVKAALRDQHKDWHSLERWQWMEGEIRFWLNPVEQDIYKTGWFSIDELIAWTHDHGPVLIEEELEEGPWDEADGVQITWLPRGRQDDPVTGRGDLRLTLS